LLLLSDITALRAETVSASHRRKLAEEANTLNEAFIGEAVVVPHTVSRMLFAGYNWTRRNAAHPVATFHERSSAVEWARALLARRDGGA
jgi:hypothetical protein